MTPIGVRLNFKNFIFMSCAVIELLRNVCQGGRIRLSSGKVGLKEQSYVNISYMLQPYTKLFYFNNVIQCLLSMSNS